MTFSYKVVDPRGVAVHQGVVKAKNEKGARIVIGKKHFIHREFVYINEVH